MFWIKDQCQVYYREQYKVWSQCVLSLAILRTYRMKMAPFSWGSSGFGGTLCGWDMYLRIVRIISVTGRTMLVSQAPQGWRALFPHVSGEEEQKEGCELTEPRRAPRAVWAGCFLCAAASQPGELETGYSWRCTCSLVVSWLFLCLNPYFMYLSPDGVLVGL